MNRRAFLQSVVSTFAFASGTRYGPPMSRRGEADWVAHYRNSALTECVFVTANHERRIYHADGCNCPEMQPHPMVALFNAVKNNTRFTTEV